MPEKIKCCALYKHLKEVYEAENDCDSKNRKIIYDFNEENKHFLTEVLPFPTNMILNPKHI